MTNKLYDILKYIQRIVLPAIIVLIGTIGKAVDFDATTIVAIISAVDVFLGSLLQINYNNYTKEQKESDQ